MENKFYQDELEQFLQEEVKQHRMYPSDHLWKNIRTELHGYRSWPALTFISLFIITALTISTLLGNHPQQLPVIKQAAVTVPENNNTVSLNSAAPHHSASYLERIAGEQITAETIADLNQPDEDIADGSLAVNRLRETSLQPIPATRVVAEKQKTADRSIIASNNRMARSQQVTNTLVISEPATAEPQAGSVEQSTVATQAEEKTTDNKTSVNNNKAEKHATADDYLKEFGYTATVSPGRNARIGFQFYITPSTSYRRLSDEKVKEVLQPAATARSSNVPLSGNSADVNTIVRHRPAVGIEMGFALLYNMSPRFKLKTGLQLNVRQYYIETYQSLTNDLATLSLINYSGVETINFYSAYNNNTGYKQTQLDNKVYQVSVPIGIQWDAIQGKHFGINTEASVQPTMTLNNNTYLLATDYKHYTTGDPFMRKWNVNTSVGFNLTFRSGSSSWQIGPQIRYQHLPTYSNAYPIREFLMDYGVKFGFTKQLR